LHFRIGSDTQPAVKSIIFLGDSRDRLREFPDKARSRTGFELGKVQAGDEPADWKPMPSVGQGVREIRVREAAGAFRVVYLAAVEEGVLVLHAFQKKTQATPKADLDLAAKRLRMWKEAR